MELISTQNNPGTYTPGNFGYLQPESGSYPTGDECGPGGAWSVVQAVAQVNSGVRTQQNGVNFQTGNDQNVYDAWDARFDDWSVTPTGSKMSIPLILGIFPVIMVILVAPAILRVMSMFQQMGRH